MNNIQNYGVIPFKGSLVIKDKNGDRTLIPANQVKYIKEKNSGNSKRVYIYTNIDNWSGSTFYRLKNIPYDKVVELYKNAVNSDNDIEIPND